MILLNCFDFIVNLKMRQGIFQNFIYYKFIFVKINKKINNKGRGSSKYFIDEKILILLISKIKN